MTIELLSTLFLVLVFVMAGIVVGLLARYLEGQARTGAIAVFAAWIFYASVMGYAGIIASKRPPGPAFLLVPVLIFIAAFLIRRPGVRTFARRISVTFLLGLQVFRVFVELGFHELYVLHLMPRMLTFGGANFDILIGVTAPIVAWLYASGRIRANAVRVWSYAGIIMLANIAIRSVLTVPGSINVFHTEVLNSAFGIFPFSYIPGFLAPLALCLHVLALRALPGGLDLKPGQDAVNG